MNKPIAVLIATAVLAFAGAAGAGQSAIHLEGSASFWWVAHEQVENGLTQNGSGDPAAQEASGFNFAQGRLGTRYISESGKVELLLRLRLEERTDIIDGWGAYHFAPWLGMYVGLMKVPSTGEVLQSDSHLDFISRTTYARVAGDYALSTTPYISLLMSTKSYHRDMGIAFKGRINSEGTPALKYFVMVANGIGGNLYVGGNNSPEYFYANNFGDYLYGARLEVLPVEWITIGGHYSKNEHDNVVFKDKKTVFDLDRETWSADLSAEIPGLGTRLYGFYSEGSLEDMWFAEEYNFDWTGWGAWAVQPLFNGFIELAVRYDTFTTEWDDDGNETEQENWTFGVNVNPEPGARMQINYVDKNTINEFVDDLDDNILYINFQVYFDQALAL